MLRLYYTLTLTLTLTLIGISGPTAMLRLYYLSCKHQLEAKEGLNGANENSIKGLRLGLGSDLDLDLEDLDLEDGDGDGDGDGGGKDEGKDEGKDKGTSNGKGKGEGKGKGKGRGRKEELKACRKEHIANCPRSVLKFIAVS